MVVLRFSMVFRAVFQHLNPLKAVSWLSIILAIGVVPQTLILMCTSIVVKILLGRMLFFTVGMPLAVTRKLFFRASTVAHCDFMSFFTASMLLSVP
jgi:hypothetical protein